MALFASSLHPSSLAHYLAGRSLDELVCPLPKARNLGILLVIKVFEFAALTLQCLQLQSHICACLLGQTVGVRAKGWTRDVVLPAVVLSDKFRSFTAAAA